jgi:hypothetical protein
MLLPGLYAWVATVAALASQRGTPMLSRLTALTALVALVAGPLVALDRPRLGRVLGVHTFVALCIATWALLGPGVSVTRLDPTRAFLGALGWGLFAFGWGTLRNVGSVPEEDPHAILGPPLPQRGRLPRGAAALLAVSVVSAVVVLLLAWTIDRPSHALFGHAAAVLAAIALVSAGARIAVSRSEPRVPTSPRQRLDAAARPLAAVALALSLGLLWLILR